MTAEVTASPDRSSATWSPVEECGGVRLGMVAPAQVIMVSAQGLDRVRAAVSAAVGDVSVAAGIADICPDPLVFAVAAGLPRPSGFDRSIDGGSTWRDTAPLAPGPLYAVSQVSAIAERLTSDGRRLVRVVYTTQFTDAHGDRVGSADGTSVHIGGGR